MVQIISRITPFYAAVYLFVYFVIDLQFVLSYQKCSPETWFLKDPLFLSHSNFLHFFCFKRKFWNVYLCNCYKFCFSSPLKSYCSYHCAFKCGTYFLLAFSSSKVFLQTYHEKEEVVLRAHIGGGCWEWRKNKGAPPPHTCNIMTICWLQPIIQIIVVIKNRWL